MSANTSTKSNASADTELERRLADLEERERKMSERERAAAGAAGLRHNLYERITLSTRTIDCIIIACAVLIVLCVIVGMILGRS